MSQRFGDDFSKDLKKVAVANRNFEAKSRELKHKEKAQMPELQWLPVPREICCFTPKHCFDPMQCRYPEECINQKCILKTTDIENKFLLLANSLVELFGRQVFVDNSAKEILKNIFKKRAFKRNLHFEKLDNLNKYPNIRGKAFKVSHAMSIYFCALDENISEEHLTMIFENRSNSRFKVFSMEEPTKLARKFFELRSRGVFNLSLIHI